MAAKILEFPAKQLRAEVIVDYCLNAGYKGIVCITCGNSGEELIKAAKGKIEVLIPTIQEGEWWAMERIAKEYPGYFDATSGHLPLWLMVRIGEKFHEYLEKKIQLGEPFRVPTGSGETILELRLAMPEAVFTEFIALYDYNRGSKYEVDAPLNKAVRSLFPMHFYESRGAKE